MQPTDPFRRPSKFSRLKTWLHRHPTATYAIIGSGLIIAASITAFALLWQKPEPIPVAEKPAPKPKPIEKFYAPLTGVQVSSKTATTRPVTAIMIENSPDARPQSGLKAAEIVYEAVAEGGITRFLALYQQEKPTLVGPVRSLREYNVDWLTPYNASVAHVGGSHKALQIVRNGSYRDIDQFFNPGSYWRASDRYAPHNVYTSFARLDALNASKGFKTSNPKVFERTTRSKPESQNATKVNVNISSAAYNSVYSYDGQKKEYLRDQGGAPHNDREQGRIKAKVVITLLVNMKSVFEDGYRESITTTGKGSAYVFQNGHVVKVKWSKPSRASQISFTTLDDKPFALERGKTWISAVPINGGSVSWK